MVVRAFNPDDPTNSLPEDQGRGPLVVPIPLTIDIPNNTPNIPQNTPVNIPAGQLPEDIPPLTITVPNTPTVTPPVTPPVITPIIVVPPLSGTTSTPTPVATPTTPSFQTLTLNLASSNFPASDPAILSEALANIFPEVKTIPSLYAAQQQFSHIIQTYIDARDAQLFNLIEAQLTAIFAQLNGISIVKSTT